MHKARSVLFTFLLLLTLKSVGQEQPLSLISQLENAESVSLVNPDSALLTVKKLLEGEQATFNSTGIFHCLMTVGIIHNRKDEYDLAIEIFRDAFNIADQLKNEKWKAQAQIKIGISRYDWTIYDLALENIQTAYTIAIENNLPEEESTALRYMGLIHYAEGDFDIAIKKLNQSLKIKEEIKDSFGMAGIYNTIGVINYMNKNYNIAIDNLNESIKVKNLINDLAGVGNSLLHIGNIHDIKGHLDSALYFFHLALDTINRIHHPKLKSIALGNIGETYTDMGDYEKALQYMNEAQKIKELIGDNKRIVRGLIGFGDYYFKLRNYKKSKEYYLKSAKISDSTGMKDDLLLSYFHLAETYSAMNQEKQAIEHYQKYVSLNDSVYGLRAQEQINEFQTKYESQKKQARIELLEQETKISELKRERSRNTIIFLFALASLLLALASLLFSRYQLKNRTSKELAGKNNELNKLNTNRDKFYSILAHDIRSPLSAFHHLSDSLHENYLDFEPDVQRTLIGEMKQSSGRLVGLFENLLEWAKLQSARISVKKEQFESGELINSVIDEVKNFALMHNVEVVSKQKQSFPISSDRNMITTVLRNLTINAIKFSDADQKVEIDATQVNNEMGFSVKDYGTGINIEDQKKLFKVGEDISTIGETKDKGAGLGLLVCKEFVDILHGQIRIESQPGQGTKITFSIPELIEDEAN